MIGIIGAMDEEVEQLVEVMEITREETKACMTFKAGFLSMTSKQTTLLIQELLVHLRQRLILQMLLFHQMFFIMTWMRQDLDIL